MSPLKQQQHYLLLSVNEEIDFVSVYKYNGTPLDIFKIIMDSELFVIYEFITLHLQ